MSKVVVEQSGVRLDTLVNNHYGDLSMYNEVLKANVDLNSMALSIGDVVDMPHKAVAVIEDKLW